MVASNNAGFIVGGSMSDSEALVPAQQLASTHLAHYPNESHEFRTVRNALLAEELELRRHLERVAAQRRGLPPGGEILRDFDYGRQRGFPNLSFFCDRRGVSFDVDFHTIPFHGEDALMQKHYVSKRSRRQKGVPAFLAQDAQKRVFCYADAAVRAACCWPARGWEDWFCRSLRPLAKGCGRVSGNGL
jgi:Bacterial protein of unknown function (DUF899)